MLRIAISLLLTMGVRLADYGDRTGREEVKTADWAAPRRTIVREPAMTTAQRSSLKVDASRGAGGTFV
jgi:hypothetical protein